MEGILYSLQAQLTSIPVYTASPPPHAQLWITLPTICFITSFVLAFVFFSKTQAPRSPRDFVPAETHVQNAPFWSLDLAGFLIPFMSVSTVISFQIPSLIMSYVPFISHSFTHHSLYFTHNTYHENSHFFLYQNLCLQDKNMYSF